MALFFAAYVASSFNEHSVTIDDPRASHVIARRITSLEGR
jgi:hypothetical protein